MRQFDETLHELGLFVQTTKEQHEKLLKTESELALARERLQAELLRNRTLNEELKKMTSSSIQEVSGLKDQVQKAEFELARLKKVASAQLKQQDIVYSARFRDELNRKQRQFQNAFKESAAKVQKLAQSQQEALEVWRSEVIKKLESSAAEVQSSRLELSQMSSQAELAQSEVQRQKEYLAKLSLHYQTQFATQEHAFEGRLRELESLSDQQKSHFQKKLDQSLTRCEDLQKQYDQMVKAYQTELSNLELELDRVRRKLPLTELLTIKDQQISRLKSQSDAKASNPIIREHIENLEEVRDRIRSELNH